MSICGFCCASFGFAPPKFIGIIGTAPLPLELIGGNPKPPKSAVELFVVPNEKELKAVGALDVKRFVFELRAANGLAAFVPVPLLV